jgi:hypothetical protein
MPESGESKPKPLLRKIADWWATFRFGPPCPKHPAHRQRELDMEIETGCAMVEDMCPECWEEERVRYNIQ